MVVTFPNVNTDPLQADTERIRFAIRYTGQPLQDADVVPLYIDGVQYPNRGSRIREAAPVYTVKRSIMPEAFTVGTHELVTKVVRDGATVPGSELSFKYHIGEITDFRPTVDL